MSNQTTVYYLSPTVGYISVALIDSETGVGIAKNGNPITLVRDESLQEKYGLSWREVEDGQ